MEENDDKRVLKATGPEYLHNFSKMCIIPIILGLIQISQAF